MRNFRPVDTTAATQLVTFMVRVFMTLPGHWQTISSCRRNGGSLWHVANCSATVRNFRLVATTAAMQLVTSMIRVIMTLTDARDTAQRQLEAEEKRKGNKVISLITSQGSYKIRGAVTISTAHSISEQAVRCSDAQELSAAAYVSVR